MTETVSDWVLVPDDLLTHIGDWESACEIARDHAAPATVDADDKSYWEHQLRTIANIKAALRTPPQMKAERDALNESYAATYELMVALTAKLEAAEADLTRYIDIATKEATEAESLRAERDALAKEVRQWRAAFDAAFPAKPTLQGDAK